MNQNKKIMPLKKRITSQQIKQYTTPLTKQSSTKTGLLDIHYTLLYATALQHYIKLSSKNF